MKFIFSLALICASVSANALIVGQKVKTLRSTDLMSGTTKLAPIDKGTELDVLAIDKKSNAWFSTEVGGPNTPVKGWVKIRDVASIPNACSSGYKHECWTSPHQECSTKCDPPVCTPTQNWVCTYEYGYNPTTGEYEYFNNCGWVTSENCSSPVCHQECWPTEVTHCGCVKIPTPKP